VASQALAQRVWQRARARCEYCQMPQEFDPLPFQIDHIIARKHRGRTRMENLALACLPATIIKAPTSPALTQTRTPSRRYFIRVVMTGRSILSGMALNLSDVHRLVGRRLLC
jgi:5-methylcytosine-specific restriction endonuclease McrA